MNMKPVVNRMVTLARENLIYMSYGEWDGNPKDLDELSLEFLTEMKSLCEIAIIEKARRLYDK